MMKWLITEDIVNDIKIKKTIIFACNVLNIRLNIILIVSLIAAITKGTKNVNQNVLNYKDVLRLFYRTEWCTTLMCSAKKQLNWRVNKNCLQDLFDFIERVRKDETKGLSASSTQSDNYSAIVAKNLISTSCRVVKSSFCFAIKARSSPKVFVSKTADWFAL